MDDGSYFDLQNWTYIYDHSPLEKTLEKYIDYKKLNLAAREEEKPTFFDWRFKVCGLVDCQSSKRGLG